MTGGLGRLGASVGVVTVVVTAVICAAPQAARADEPTLTVTPTTGLRAGDVVTLQYSGFLDGRSGAFECDASVGTAPDLEALIANCGSPVPVELGTGTVELTIEDTFTTEGSTQPRPVRCGDQPHDCVVAMLSVPFDPEIEPFLAVPIDIVPGPLGVTPRSDIVTPADVDIFATGDPGSSLAVAQCAAPPGTTLGASRCGPTVPLSLDATGNAHTRLTVTATLDTSAGPVECDTAPCVVAAFDAAGTTVASIPITVIRPFDPLGVTVTPNTGLARTAPVEIRVTGRQDVPITVKECRSFGNIPCRTLGQLDPVPRSQPARIVTAEVTDAFFPDDGFLTVVRCAPPESCVIVVTAVESPVPPETVVAPLEFAAPRRMVLTPSSDLVDRQDLAVDASGLDPGTYAVVHCLGDEQAGFQPLCEDPATAPHITVSADERFTGTFPAVQRFTSEDGRHWRCMVDCVLGLWRDGHLYVAAIYQMSFGEFSVSPSQGLVDGQSITVTGTKLMASYDGPPVWIFPTGLWGVVQCGFDVFSPDGPTLVSVFEHCQSPPSGGLVNVPGSDLVMSIQVRSQVHSIIGGNVADCTQGTCVILLGRLEQDGTVSTHTAFINFAPATPP
jgi:hypothetical protein